MGFFDRMKGSTPETPAKALNDASVLPESIFGSVMNHFLAHKVPMETVDKRNRIIQLTLPGPIVSRVFVSEDGSALMIRCVFCANAPMSRKGSVAELLVRLNDAMQAGCFGMDWSDGQVTFRLTHWTTGPVPDDVMLRIVGGTVNTINRFKEPIKAVMMGISPDEALRMAKG